jgi:hypothetical protein
MKSAGVDRSNVLSALAHNKYRAFRVAGVLAHSIKPSNAA